MEINNDTYEISWTDKGGYHATFKTTDLIVALAQLALIGNNYIDLRHVWVCHEVGQLGCRNTGFEFCQTYLRR